MDALRMSVKLTDWTIVGVACLEITAPRAGKRPLALWAV